MIKLIVQITAKEGISRAEFEAHYETVHAPKLLRIFPMMCDYRRNYIERAGTVLSPNAVMPDFSVVTEIWLRDEAAFAAFLERSADPEAVREIREDEAKFLETSKTRTFVVKEYRSDAGKPLGGKTAIVTGAGRGIGRAIAQRLAAEGARVVVATRTRSYGDEAVAAISGGGGTASLVVLDIADRAAVDALVAGTVDRFGGIDILVHAAGDYVRGTLDTIDDEAFDLSFDTTVKAAFHLTQASAPHMPAGGRMIFVSSIAARKTNPYGTTHYAAAKSALNAFARGAAVELGPRGITVNTVDPGMIASDRNRRTFTSGEMAARTSGLPVARPGEPEDVAAAVLHLALPESGYVTGAHVPVDGGLSL